MAKHTQTIRRQIVDKLFECVLPFCVRIKGYEMLVFRKILRKYYMDDSSRNWNFLENTIYSSRASYTKFEKGIKMKFPKRKITSSFFI